MTPTIPGYEVFELIGQGGMARIYRARQTRLEREVALKVMSRSVSEDATFAERFIREARIAANLNHPHIIHIYDVNHFEDTLFLSMEYIRHGDLTNKMELGDLTRDAIVNIINSLCSALDYAHQNGYIHRDIKPANVLFKDENYITLSDFGIARAISTDANLTRTGTVIGTPSYMSPEQAQGLELTGMSDLYSLAVIAYQLVTGQLPFIADSSISVAIKHIYEPIPRLPAELTDLQPFFDKALAKNPPNRFANGADLSAAFADAVARHKGPLGMMAAVPSADKVSPVNRDSTVARTDEPAKPLTAEQLLNSAGKSGTVAEKSPILDALDSPGQAVSSGKPQSADRSPTNPLPRVVTDWLTKLRPSEKKPVILAAVAVAGLFIGLIFGFANDWFSSGEQLTPVQQQRVTQLLQQAAQLRQAGQLVEPAGANAYEKYLAILAISHEDPAAEAGIEELTKHFIERTKIETAQGNLLGAENSLMKLRELSPNSKQISSLEQAIAEATEAQQAQFETQQAEQQKRRERIALQLSVANQQLAEGQIAAAISTYQAVLPLEPDSEEARAALQGIVDTQLQAAQQKVKARVFDQAGSELDLAMSAAEALNEPRVIQQVTKKISMLDRQKQRSQSVSKISSLISAGNQAFKNDRLDSPPNKNAYHYYKAALKVDPKNTEAQRGLKKVFNRLSTQAYKSMNDGNIDAARSYISRLEKLAPNHDQLNTLRVYLKRAAKRANR